MSDLAKHAPPSADAENFKNLSEKLCSFVAASGASLRGFDDPSLPLFTALSTERQLEILNEMQKTISFCATLQEAGWELTELKKLIWFAVSQLGLRSPGGVFMDLIEDGDVVEIHSTVSLIVRSFTHYNFCSYSHEEISTIHWSELYQRPAHILAQLETAITKAFSENLILSNPVPAHDIAETRSRHRYEKRYTPKYFIPFTERGQKNPTHLMAIIRAEHLTKDTQTDTARLLQNFSLAQNLG